MPVATPCAGGGCRWSRGKPTGNHGYKEHRQGRSDGTKGRGATRGRGRRASAPPDTACTHGGRFVAPRPAAVRAALRAMRRAAVHDPSRGAPSPKMSLPRHAMAPCVCRAMHRTGGGGRARLLRAPPTRERAHAVGDLTRPRDPSRGHGEHAAPTLELRMRHSASGAMGAAGCAALVRRGTRKRRESAEDISGRRSQGGCPPPQPPAPSAPRTRACRRLSTSGTSGGNPASPPLPRALVG